MSEEQATETVPISLGPLLKTLARSALWPGLMFGPLIAYLMLHRMGHVSRIKEIAYERTLILNVLLYWLVATVLLAAWRHRDEVRRWLASQVMQIALLTFSCLISFAFAEVALRILRPHTAAQSFERLASETLHHRNAPDRRSMGMGGKWVETNADGLRTPYSRDEFLAFEHRVVLLGDSFTFGLGVEERAGVAAILEEKLRQELGDSVSVLNTGVISYSPYLERQMFHEIARHYKPTMTLLLLDANDIGDDYQYERENISDDPDRPRFDVPPIEDEGPGLCDLSAICRALAPVWDRLGKPKQVLWALMEWDKEAYDYYAFEAPVGEVVEKNRFFILRHPLDATRSYFDRTWGNVEAVARDVEAEGSAFAFVVMPRFFHWDDEECPQNWEADRYGADEPFENVFLEYFDEKLGVGGTFPIFSLLGAFLDHQEVSTEPAVFDHDPHWNEVGHKIAGEALAGWLIDEGWPAQAPTFAGSRGSFVDAPTLPAVEASEESEGSSVESEQQDQARAEGDDR